jgi:hypothetical protein
MMLAEVYAACGVIPYLEIPFYPADWRLGTVPRPRDAVLQYAIEISGPPPPGDVAVFRFSRCHTHGAIVVEWPRIIHARVTMGMIYGDARQPKLASREPCFLIHSLASLWNQNDRQKKPRHSRSEALCL